MLNWIIRVYEKDSDEKPLDVWIIENRIETEAEREASWTILANYPEAEDWTMMPYDK